jgi:hypothetical protein
MAIRADGPQDGTGSSNPRQDDEVLVAPFSRGITSVTGPTTDRATVLEGDQPSGPPAEPRFSMPSAVASALAGGRRRRAIVRLRTATTSTVARGSRTRWRR